MDSKFQTSFIPKKNFEEGGRVKNKTPINILSVISTVLITIAILGAGGVFGYKLILERQVEAKKSEIAEVQASLDLESVEEVSMVDNKLKAAATLLDGHTSVSSFFSVLERNTLANVRFTDFSFSYLANDTVAVSMKGIARNFGVVAKQEERFAASAEIRENFRNPLFSGFTLDEAGNVSFSLLTTVNKKLISYKPTATVPQTAATAAPAASSSANTLNQ